MDIRNIDNPDAPPPLYIVDGAIASPADVKKIDPELIGSINVIKDKGNNSRATSKYGDQGKNGVVEITTKKKMAESGDMIAPPPPPPPPQSVLDIKSADGKAILYIIDGVKYKDDLKDGSATSVYGEEGKSGVILITTKKDGKHPLVVVDGIIKDIDVNRIDPATIESLSVPGKYAAARKYGDKAKDGVVEIKLKKPAEKIQDTKE
jgi:TonB-dependent SusC/RagA subfamily outer membrane receptor